MNSLCWYGVVSVACSLLGGSISHHGADIVCSLMFLEQAKAALSTSAHITNAGDTTWISR